MNKLAILIACLTSLLLTTPHACLRAQDAYSREQTLLDSLIKSTLGLEHEAGFIFHVNPDSALRTLSVEERYIADDINEQLRDCTIGIYRKWHSVPKTFPGSSGIELSDHGGIFIARRGKLLWHSARILKGDADSDWQVSGFADLNGDGITDIIVSVYSGKVREYEAVWLVTPTPTGGRLLCGLDREGHSQIWCNTGHFQIISQPNEKVKKLQADDRVYEWDGSEFRVVIVPQNR